MDSSITLFIKTTVVAVILACGLAITIHIEQLLRAPARSDPYQTPSEPYVAVHVGSTFLAVLSTPGGFVSGILDGMRFGN